MKRKLKPHQTETKSSTVLANTVNPDRWKNLSWLAVIVFVSFLVYLPIWHNSFVNWDDDLYIKDNPLVYSFNLNGIFSKYVASNYHPLTILALAIEYHFFKLNATGYHAVNLFLHLLNVILVFNVVLLLSDKTKVALVAALLFGIHPIHIESVAWAAELKDLLYTFFFLSSYIFYLKYLKDLQRKYYVFAVFLFLLSLLSKAMAASLPVVLLLTDYFLGRKINAKTLLEKIPFFLLALTFGIIAIFAQKSSGATDMVVFPLSERLVFAAYGYISYLIKLVFPLHLSAYYPYPVKPGVDIPILYYAYLVLLIGMAALVFYSLRFSKIILFGIGFFSITVLLVLQLLPVGGAIMADRYCYIPSIGLFYLAGECFDLALNNKRNAIAILLLSAFTICFTIQSYSRTSVWNNSFTLWEDVINQYQTIPQAYNNRGLIFKKDKKQDPALADFGKAIQLDVNYFEAYINRGNTLRDNNKFAEAHADYDKAIELKPFFYKAYINRGILLLAEKRYDEALKDFNKCIELNPEFVDSYYHIGLVHYYQKSYEEAITNYNQAIRLKPTYAEAYFSRGVSEYYSGKNEIACADLKKAAGLGYVVPGEVLKEICK